MPTHPVIREGRLDEEALPGRPVKENTVMPDQSRAMPLQVDIVSDVVCPWCIIGYKQLMKALGNLPGEFDVALCWHPFELNPQMPAQGQNLREHLAQKYGVSPGQSGAARDRLTDLGTSLGFVFNYADDMRMVNTFRAHQLLHWAREQGRQTELKLALFEAFFTHGQDVSATAVLAAVADDVGLSRSDAEAILNDGRYAQVVRQEQQAWLEKEVHAVPYFVFNEQYAVPGAQDSEVFVRILGKIRASETASSAI